MPGFGFAHGGYSGRRDWGFISILYTFPINRTYSLAPCVLCLFFKDLSLSDVLQD
jgi:hypothetical protein